MRPPGASQPRRPEPLVLQPAHSCLGGAELFCQTIVERVGYCGKMPHRLLNLPRIEIGSRSFANSDDPVAHETKGSVRETGCVELEKPAQEGNLIGPVGGKHHDWRTDAQIRRALVFVIRDSDQNGCATPFERPRGLRVTCTRRACADGIDAQLADRCFHELFRVLEVSVHSGKPPGGYATAE